jgi:hypothetical protein
MGLLYLSVKINALFLVAQSATQELVPFSSKIETSPLIKSCD